ncbi:hypothetical protein D3P08_05380 [Paenibacillus nanensis]|uniref:DsrE family protein n=1 Tax=Paenibacillus nanensis TaxID=393251 RepID=A0A3A1VQ26_9BACL|nr:hypothetical protein [Paenibacillus nanensis]RIX59570.1 hypothetical protein D3P08_05380 [Paenibacillus nanensis]
MAENKYLVVIQANQQDIGKAVHGLLYGEELHDAGFKVEIVFDGLGTQWPEILNQAEHPFHSLFKQVMKKGIVKGGCQACSTFFDVGEQVQSTGLALVGNEAAGGHIPFAQYMKDGFVPIIL